MSYRIPLYFCLPGYESRAGLTRFYNVLPHAQAFNHRKSAKTNGLVAIKALGNKLARASYYLMRGQLSCGVSKPFR